MGSEMSLRGRISLSQITNKTKLNLTNVAKLYYPYPLWHEVSRNVKFYIDVCIINNSIHCSGQKRKALIRLRGCAG